jgi:hypothetical protein
MIDNKFEKQSRIVERILGILKNEFTYAYKESNVQEKIRIVNSQKRSKLLYDALNFYKDSNTEMVEYILSLLNTYGKMTSRYSWEYGMSVDIFVFNDDISEQLVSLENKLNVDRMNNVTESEDISLEK